jgi:hypothetical protein
MIIKIPFNERFVMPIARGQKIYTTRTKQYGNPNDYFYVAKGRKIKCILTGITRVRLGDVMYKYYWQEGFNSPAEFKQFWLTIHRKWQPEKYYWLHSFRRT